MNAIIPVRAVLVLIVSASGFTLHAQRPDPMDAKGFIERGNAWTEGGEWDKAIRDYTEAMRLEPKNGEAYIGRGLVLIASGSPAKARKDFDEAIRLDSKNPKAYFGRGASRAAERDFDAAISDYTKAIELDPKYAFAYGQRSYARQRKGDWDEAVKDAEEAVKLSPKVAGVFSIRGAAYQGKGEWGKALADFEESIKLDSRYYRAYANKAQILAACPDSKYRDGQKALKAAKYACELTRWRNSYELETYAAAAAETGDFEEAVKWQKKVLDDPEHLKWNRADPRARLELYESKKPFRLPTPPQKG